MTGSYDDLIHLPHHVSATRPQMPIANRAAQFSPFAALAGYDAAVKETARRTHERVELNEDAQAALDIKLGVLTARLPEHPEVAITYFLPDKKKEGGAYVTVTGAVKKMDEYERAIVLMDNQRVALEDILDIACALFHDSWSA